MKHNAVTITDAPAYQNRSVGEAGTYKKEVTSDYKNSSAWHSVSQARKKGRLTSLEFIEGLIEGFIECHGDRGFMDDEAIVGGIGWFNDRAVTIIGQQKGRDVEENVRRNFGMPHPEGYRKALRLMKQAEKFNRPIICLIDTSGAFCGLGAEERGQGEAIARNLIEMAGLTVPVISIVIGEGGSGGALALGIANAVYMLEHAIYSVLSPEGFASILWKDASRAAEAAGLMKITAKDLLSFGLIDGIISETTDSPSLEDEKAFIISKMKETLTMAISQYEGFTKEALVAQRAYKFRQMGI